MCHHLSKIRDQGALNFTIGLVGGRPCPRRARNGILKFLGDEFVDDPLSVANSSRINDYEVCSKGNVVLMKAGDEVVVGRVAQHFSLGDIAFSLVHPWTLIRHVATTELYIYSTSADAELWQTSDILLAVEHTVFPDGTAGILMPLPYRV